MSDAQPTDEPEDRGPALGKPALVTVLFVLALAAPWVLNLVNPRRAPESPAKALDRWQHELEQAGLPTPFVEPVDVVPPEALSEAKAERLIGAIREQYDLLNAWRLMRGGYYQPAPKARTVPGRVLREALDACYAMNAAAQGRPEALEDAVRSANYAAPYWRPTLAVTIDLLAGRDATRASELLADPELHPACRAPLDAVVRELERRRAATEGSSPPQGE